MAYGAPMTFSIAARDPNTGALGVAVHSHAFSVGSIVPWVEAGVGAVATQSLPLLEAGPRGLALLGEGATAREVLDTLAGEDDAFASRQIGVVGADGSSASHTGEGCIPVAAHHVGEELAVQGNILATEAVVPAMVQAFTGGKGDLQDRLLAALDAAQAAGGDLRGQQSAALVTVAGARSAPMSQQQRTQLHVDDHPTPLTELRRLLVLRRAYDRLEEADELVAAGQLTAAVSATATPSTWLRTCPSCSSGRPCRCSVPVSRTTPGPGSASWSTTSRTGATSWTASLPAASSRTTSATSPPEPSALPGAVSPRRSPGRWPSGPPRGGW